MRKLAGRFIAADFYSLEPDYRLSATDLPTYRLSISIDSHNKDVRDYAGTSVGMPGIVVELENAVDSLAGTERWIKGTDGLVQTLRAEKFNFETFDAQKMAKRAANQGQTSTVRELLGLGVPLTPLHPPKTSESEGDTALAVPGWLESASAHPEVLDVLIGAGASKYNQVDKDLGLIGAARSGNLNGVRTLIAYGANPNADLTQLTVTEGVGGMGWEGPGAGSVLIYAAESGSPDVVREILRHHPTLEARNYRGETALFGAGEYRESDAEGARVEIVRLLVAAGADVNARDNAGNTPLHGIFLTDVEEELLKLGANVNARNDDGETPIFTNVDSKSIALFIKLGADLTIRNKKGQTAVEAAQGPIRREAFEEAIANSEHH